MIRNLSSRIFEIIVGARNCLFDLKVLPIYRSKLPVICVGNISVGGNGKTPLCLYLVTELLQRGFKPCILLRGYKGKLLGPLIVNEQHQASEVGDEAKLMYQRKICPVVVAKKRVLGCKYIEKNKLADLIILDDGLQHRWLHRDVNIATQDISTTESITQFVNGKLLPAGNLREPRDHALERCQMIIFAKRLQQNQSARLTISDLPDRLTSLIPKHIEIFRSYISDVEIRNLQGEKIISVPSEAHLISAIANPQAFRQTVLSCGIKIATQNFYADHHYFQLKDLLKIPQEISPILCTEKDAVKISELNLPNELRQRLLVLGLSIKVIPSDTFIVKLLKNLQR